LRTAVERRRAWAGRDCDPRACVIDAVRFDELKKCCSEFFISWCVCNQKTVDASAKPAEMSIKEGWRPVANGQRVKDPIAQKKTVIVCKDRW
jgi:hypothetical protein